jgi:hypothetical protein
MKDGGGDDDDRRGDTMARRCRFTPGFKTPAVSA